MLASITRGASNGYRHIAYTFAPDGQSIISGGDGGVLIAYDLRGAELGHFVGHEADIWAVTPSSDGRLMVSGSQDQTIRLWNLKTRELIVTLFHGSDGEWVMDAAGYYTGSPDADKMVGWQISRGPETRPFTSVPTNYASILTARHHRRTIVLASPRRAVRGRSTSFKLADLLTKPVPRFRIVSPSQLRAAAGRESRSPSRQCRSRQGSSGASRRSERRVSRPTTAPAAFGEQIFDIPLAGAATSTCYACQRHWRRPRPGSQSWGRRRPRQARHSPSGNRRRPIPAMGNTCGDGTRLRYALPVPMRAWADAAERRPVLAIRSGQRCW